MNRFVLLLLLIAAPVLAQDRPDALLVLADDGALDAPAVHAIRNIAASELRRRGIAITEAEGLRPVDAALTDLADELGARRLFALRVGGRLGQKIPLSLEELTPGLRPVYSASLTATGLEECDVVTARLVQAVVDRRTADSTAGIRTVTASESRPFAKKPGERFWFIGLPVPLYNANRGTPSGFSLGYGYEAENFRVSASVGGFNRASEGAAYLLMEAFWLPLDGEWSPYFGGGLGYMGANTRGGMGAALEGGIEAFRLHGVRALAGVQVLVPFFDATHQESTYAYDPTMNGTVMTTTTVPGRSILPAAFLRLAF